LATVYGIVRQHRGWITVETELGRGTTFRIFVPASQQQTPVTPQAEASGPAKGGRETVLVVEDEQPLRLLVRSILEHSGYQVIEAGSGVAALDAWPEVRDRVDLLLTDMVMPDGMTGRELAERLQAEKPGLRVLYTSGYSAEVVGEDFVLTEGLNFLQKPYHARKLAEAVRRCLDAPPAGH